MKAILILGNFYFEEHPYKATLLDVEKYAICSSEEVAGERGEKYIESGLYDSYLVVPTYKGAIESEFLRIPADLSLLSDEEKVMRIENALIDFMESRIQPERDM